MQGFQHEAVAAEGDDDVRLALGRGALLRHNAKVSIEVLEPELRPVSAVADNYEVRDVVRVEVAEDRSIGLHMLFDAGRSLEERVLAEQFSA